MRAILGIDAAWTEREPSGVALLLEGKLRWSCVALAPSYESFIALCDGRAVDWSARPRGSRPPVPELVSAAERIARCDVEVVAVDMPMSLQAIDGRRCADDAVSREFGGRHCSTHSPSVNRPGSMGADLSAEFKALCFDLATTHRPRPPGRTLLEVYPHTALLSLLAAERRVPYKVSKSSKYWPKATLPARIDELLKIFRRIHSGLEYELGPVPIAIPESANTLNFLKRYEDALDAVISGWMGMLYVTECATPFGDEAAAIWVPTLTIRSQNVACPPCTSTRSLP